MAPPPLPQDYGGGTAGGFKIPAPPAAAPIQDDDWGWKPDEQTNNSARETTGARYGNVDDDLWSTNTGNDTNYNQVREHLIFIYYIRVVWGFFEPPTSLPRGIFST